MAVYFSTTIPEKLLNSFRTAIDEGHVKTWSYDDNGDFTHTADQWKNLALLRPRRESGKLVFNIFAPPNRKISPEIYAIYHGRVIESMLAHLDKMFINGVATALADQNDSVG